MSVGQRVDKWRGRSLAPLRIVGVLGHRRHHDSLELIQVNLTCTAPSSYLGMSQTASSLVARTVTIGVYNLHNAI